jgi:hypothetical protein
MGANTKPDKDIREIPLIDPTENVLKHVEGAVKRLDDLQLSEDRRQAEILTLNVKRLDDLRSAESRRIDEEAKMREDFANQLREAEAKRIDAIRAVDVNAVAVASERASAQASLLATQVSQSAEALRVLVASTATTMATQQDQSSKQSNDRLAQVEKAQYENQGRSGVADPLFIELLKEVKLLRTSGAEHSGEKVGAISMGDWVIRIVLFVLALAGFGIAVFKQ